MSGGVRSVALAPSSYHPTIGGVQELTAKLASSLNARGVDTVVSTMRWPKTVPATERVDGVPVHRFVFRSHEGDAKRLGIALATTPSTLAGLVRYYKHAAVEIVHVQCVSNAAWYQQQAARILRVPLVVSLQGELTMDATGVYERSARLRKLLRSLLASADAVTACSQDTLGEAEEWFGRSLGSRGRVIYNGVDVDEIRAAPAASHPRPYVFAIGRHVPQKGFDVLIEAFGMLVGGGSRDLDLVLAGDGPDLAALQEQARHAGLTDRVHFLGRTDRSATASCFRGAAAFVMPSRHEPFGIVNLEAMAAGVPIVATRVGGVPEFVHHETNGLLVSPGSPAELAAALDRLLGDESLCDRLVESSTERVAAFRWSAITEQYLDVYGDVTQHRARRR